MIRKWRWGLVLALLITSTWTVSSCSKKSRGDRTCDESSASFRACMDEGWTYKKCAIMNQQGAGNRTMDECKEIVRARCCR